MNKILYILFVSFIFSGELEVDGNLKVIGNIDANGNTITNVGEPVVLSDVATANYVNSRTVGKGRIISLKCPWYGINVNNTCEPPACPEGWDILAESHEVTSLQLSGGSYYCVGNSIRYCTEQEDEE